MIVAFALITLAFTVAVNAKSAPVVSLAFSGPYI
jgi:hypothetical protein